MKFFPRYLLIVFAFAGYSTMTSERAMLSFVTRIRLPEGTLGRPVSFSLP